MIEEKINKITDEETEADKIEKYKILLDSLRHKIDYQLSCDNQLEIKASIILAFIGVVLTIDNNIISILLLTIPIIFSYLVLKPKNYDTGDLNINKSKIKETFYIDMKNEELLLQLLSDYEDSYKINNELKDKKSKYLKYSFYSFLFIIFIIFVLKINCVIIIYIL